MFSLAVRYWTTPAKATGQNMKRRKKALYWQGQGVWNTGLSRMDDPALACDLLVIKSQKSWTICRPTEPSGTAQPCHLAFQHLSAPLIFHILPLLAFISGFRFPSLISFLHHVWESAVQRKAMLENDGCGSFPHRLGATQPGTNKAAGFCRGRYVVGFFFLGKHVVSSCVEFANLKFPKLLNTFILLFCNSLQKPSLAGVADSSIV